MTLDVMHRSLCGSHAWGMERPDSDKDIFTVYRTPTIDILKSPTGVRGDSIRNKQDKANRDETKHEIGHVCQMLIGGNINYLIGVLSPAVEYTTPEMGRLQKILRDYPSKAIIHSAQGLAHSNYIKYLVQGYDDSPKKRALILRTVRFAIGIIENGIYDFSPVVGTVELEEIGRSFKRLKEIGDASTMRSHYPKDLLTDWLLDVRLKNLKEATP